MKKKPTKNLHLHDLYLLGDAELDEQAQQSVREQLSESQDAESIASELRAMQSLFSADEFVEDSEAFVRATMQRLDQPGFLETLRTTLQPTRSTLEWSFASVVLLFGVALTQDNPITSGTAPQVNEEEATEDFEDQELIQAFEQEYSLMNTELQIFDLGEV